MAFRRPPIRQPLVIRLPGLGFRGFIIRLLSSGPQEPSTLTTWGNFRRILDDIRLHCPVGGSFICYQDTYLLYYRATHCQ